MKIMKTEKENVNSNVEAIKMDISTARWLVEHMDDDDAFPLDIEQCEECHSFYLIGMMHECGKSMEVPVHKECDENDD